MRSSSDGVVVVGGQRVVRVRPVRTSLDYRMSLTTYAVSDIHSPKRLYADYSREACERWALAQGFRVIGPHEVMR